MRERINLNNCGYVSPSDEHGPVLPAATGHRSGYFTPVDLEHAVLASGASTNPPSGMSGIADKLRATPNGPKVGFRARIACYQWTWFTMTMATGGIANVIHSLPYDSDWLTVIGTIFFILNMVLFAMNCILITMRFCWQSGSFVDSFTDQVESLFIPAFFVSIGTICINITQYGLTHAGPWLAVAMEAMFWVYVTVSTLASAGIYLTLWSTQIFPIHTMTPIWVFPAYPLLLVAPFAGNLISEAHASGRGAHINSIAITLCAVSVQGTGFLIAFMIMAAFLYRLMTQKLPRDTQRPGVFISIGPSAFTVAGIVQLGGKADVIIPPDFLETQQAIFIVKLLSVMFGLWLWGLSVWFFLVSVGSLWKYVRPERKMPFSMTWFSFVFPNTALVTATVQLGRALGSDALCIVGSAMAGCIVIVWLTVFVCMVRCLWRKELLWPKEH